MEYILKGSAEWDSFIEEIVSIKNKSNRQVLCVKCWMLLNYEQKIKHIKCMPDHEKYILTSSKFASAWQISSLALACNKIQYRQDGEYIKSPFTEMNMGVDGGQPSTVEPMNALPTDDANNGYNNLAPKNPAQEAEEKGKAEEEKAVQGNQVPGAPGLTVEALEGKVKTLQNSIDSLKVLFTQVLERVNIVNQENNYLRSLIIQTPPPQAQANQPMNQAQVPPAQGLSNSLPTLNQTSLNLGGQGGGMPSFMPQNQTGPTVAEQQQNLIDSILPILGNNNGNPMGRNQLCMPYDAGKDLNNLEKPQ